MTSLHHDAKLLGGHVSGGQILCPGPGHSKNDRSLCLRPSASSPLGYVFHSHAGDDFKSCADHIRIGLRMEPFTPTKPRKGSAELKVIEDHSVWLMHEFVPCTREEYERYDEENQRLYLEDEWRFVENGGELPGVMMAPTITNEEIAKYEERPKPKLVDESYEPPGEPVKPAPSKFNRIINPADWESDPEPEERKSIVPGYILDETVTLFSADGGSGKSYLVKQLAVARALAKEWIGLLPTPGKTLVLSTEDDTAGSILATMSD